MSKITRRALARYGADQLIAGKSASEIAAHLAGLMVESGLSRDIEFLLGDIAWELERRGELTSSKITSATPLSRDLEDDLKRQIKKATDSRSVVMEKVVDKSVIGGVRIETSERVWDSTIARKLTQLKEAF